MNRLCMHACLCAARAQVLPTSSDDGLVEFVPSTPLSRVLSEHRTIHKYLAQWQADPSGEGAEHGRGGRRGAWRVARDDGRRSGGAREDGANGASCVGYVC